jgi:hypothetical protein
VGNQCEALQWEEIRRDQGRGRGSREGQEGCDTCDGGEPYDPAHGCQRIRSSEIFLF